MTKNEKLLLAITCSFLSYLGRRMLVATYYADRRVFSFSWDHGQKALDYHKNKA